MKKPTVIIESAFEQQVRKDRAAETDQYLKLAERALERSEKGYWDDAKRMLGWYEAMRDRMGSPPAIDYAREKVQGIHVDRDERIHCIAYVEMALTHLERVQGDDRGKALLWLHFRAPRATGKHKRLDDGRKVELYSEPGVAERELHEHLTGKSRDMTIRDFWRALRTVEEFAMKRGWVRYRLQRKSEEQKAQVYQRDRSGE